MNVPVGMPIGQLSSVIWWPSSIVKQLFGGIGMNFAQPRSGGPYRAVHQLLPVP